MILHYASRFLIPAILCVACSLCHLAAAADWPQWRGPNRDGSSTETGWRSQWPEGGPKVLWKAKVGAGHSSVVAVGERAYAVGRSWRVDAKGLPVKGANDRNVGSETVWCFDANTGKVLWQHAADCQNLGCNDWGTNSTPAVFDGLIYAYGAPGKVACLDGATGRQVWARDLARDYAAKLNIYGCYAGSPLVVEEGVIVECGGEQPLLAALDRKTGREVWKYGKATEIGGASSPVPYRAGNRAGIVHLARGQAVGLAAGDGKQLWRYPWSVCALMTPLVHGDRVYVSGVGEGDARLGTVLELGQNPPKPVWSSKEMISYFQSSVLVDGHLFGIHAPGYQATKTRLRCVAFDTGKVMWEHTEKGLGHATLITADHKLIIQSQQGVLIVAEASPQGFKKLASAKVLDHTCYNCECYTCPTLSHGRIYCRSGGGELVCLDVRTGQ
ncbi:MAG: PQQ-binding-like beta-propeller repeat protein [Thermoguttaceae bacterium]|jgi:outer membrane protein assembly factor BamB